MTHDSLYLGDHHVVHGDEAGGVAPGPGGIQDGTVELLGAWERIPEVEVEGCGDDERNAFPAFEHVPLAIEHNPAFSYVRRGRRRHVRCSPEPLKDGLWAAPYALRGVFTRVILLILCTLGVLAAVSPALGATPKAPAKHHGYRWSAERLLCTSVLKERRANDTVTVRYQGKRYWCSRPPGSPELAGEALRFAIQERIKPGSGYGYQALKDYGCPGKAGVYRCSFTSENITGTATVTFKPKPVVVFTAFACSPEMTAYSPQGCA